MNNTKLKSKEWYTPNYDVYDRVWVMENNKPKEMIILSAVMTASYNKSGQDVYYMLVSTLVGAGVAPNNGVRRTEDDFFNTKEELIASL